MLTEPVEEDTPAADPEVTFLSDFLKGLHSFEGTATELCELLEVRTGESILPSVLSKKLVKYAGELEQNGIHVAAHRTRDSRTLSILCFDSDGSDGNDGKTGTVPVANFLSQPSQLSRDG